MAALGGRVNTGVAPAVTVATLPGTQAGSAKWEEDENYLGILKKLNRNFFFWG